MNTDSPPLSNRKRVALISYSWGEICCRTANALADQAEVLLILSVRQAERSRHLLDHRVTLVEVEVPRLRQPVRQWRAQRQATRAIERFKPDVLHVQHGHFWFNMFLPALRRRYPVIISIHDPRHHAGDKSSQRSPQWMFDFGFRRADRIIAHTAAMRQMIVEEIGIDIERTDVVPLPGIGEPDLATDLPEQRDSLLWFGRIWEYKGLDRFIKLQPTITERIPGATFIIAGEGEDIERYRSAMVDPDRFEVHNHYISEEDVAALFKRAGVVVLPYREATQSGVVGLAASFAKPVIATDVGGLGEQIDHGVTGLLVPPDNHEELAAAVTQLLEDDQLRRKMGRAAQEKLEHDWSPSAIAEATIGVYRAAQRSRSVR